MEFMSHVNIIPREIIFIKQLEKYLHTPSVVSSVGMILQSKSCEFFIFANISSQQ